VRLVPWAAGTRFSRYEIDSLLATGGMAEVWRARIKGAAGFEKRIVIKTMLPSLQHRTELVRMFVEEASVAAQLSHPNVAHVFDFGQVEGRYFIAMEYVPGVTLRFAHKRMLARGSRLAMATALHVMRDVCEALHHLHDLGDEGGALGLVHRDLSPDNVIISPSGTAKLIDFGAARATARTPPTPVFVGKYRYSAPERVRHEGEDRRSDVFSTGVILYECLTGVRPFDGTEVDVIRGVLRSRACDPRVDLPGIPEPVAALVMKATAYDPAARYASARDMSAALASCLTAIGASSKERDVSESLAALADVPSSIAARSSSVPPTASAPTAPADEAVPEMIDAITDANSSAPEIALSELEMIEASGPIRVPTIATVRDRAQHLPPPVPAAPPPDPPRPIAAIPALVAERAVQLFDRGIELRAAGRYEDALDAWDEAAVLAPQNHVYNSSAIRLREQLAQIDDETGGEPTPPLAPDRGE
jgi:serine/threonine-protein kinase